MPRTQTLRVGDRKVRTTTNKRYHVAVPYRDRLQVTKRTDSLQAVVAEIRRLRRLGHNRSICLFDHGQHVDTF